MKRLSSLVSVLSLGVSVLGVCSLSGCGGGTPSAKSADAADDGDSSAAEASGGDGAEDGGEAGSAAAEESVAPGGLPTKCAKNKGDVCLPPEKLAKALCDADFPSVALSMFQQGSPWTRAYVAGRNIKAWNASGGGSSPEKLILDEEVLVLRYRAAKTGGMVVSGAGNSYDVLRWDGGCVTLAEGELTMHEPPGSPKNARIIWKRLEIAIRDALKEDKEVYDVYLKHKKTCKGVSMGTVSKACVTADGKLSRIIAKRVRENGGVPAPKKMPEL